MKWKPPFGRKESPPKVRPSKEEMDLLTRIVRTPQEGLGLLIMGALSGLNALRLERRGWVSIFKGRRDKAGLHWRAWTTEAGEAAFDAIQHRLAAEQWPKGDLLADAAHARGPKPDRQSLFGVLWWRAYLGGTEPLWLISRRASILGRAFASGRARSAVEPGLRAPSAPRGMKIIKGVPRGGDRRSQRLRGIID